MTATAARDLLDTRLAWLVGCAIAALAVTSALATPTGVNAAQSGSQAKRQSAKHAQRGDAAKRHRGNRRLSRAQRRRLRARARHRRRARARRARRARRIRARRASLIRTRRANRRASVSSNTAVSSQQSGADSSTAPTGVLDAGFEDGLLNWNTAGVGEVIPAVVDDTVRSGARSCKAVLSGSQNRSELILGGNGGGSTAGMVEFHEGEEYWYGFSFYIVSMVYGEPGAHNLIMQFKGNDGGSPSFGLQLWDYEGDHGEYQDNPRGLWSHGSSMDGDRLLAPVAERAWHDVAIHFKASGTGAGFYELYLDGHLIDARSDVSMIAAGADYAYVKNGLYRDGGDIPGTSEIRLDAARLGRSAADVAVG